MKKSVLTVLSVLLPILASAQVKPDTLFFVNGEKAIASISKMSSEDVEYTYPNEVLVNSAKVSELLEVHLGSGRVVKYVITEAKKDKLYPDSYVLELGNYSIEMVLVVGGTFDMGYDGRHSIRMRSEPVHPVTLTSFYISKSYISRGLHGYLMKDKSSDNDRPFLCVWKDASLTTQKVAEIKGQAYRLPTEAEWEYAAKSSASKVLFEDNAPKEWCLDFLGDFLSTPEPVIDPTGYAKGGPNVKRRFDLDEAFYDRSSSTIGPDAAIRIAIKAADVFPDL